MMKRRIALLLAVACVLLAVIQMARRKGGSPPAGTDSPPPSQEAPAVSVQNGLTVIGDTGFERNYGAPDGSPERDLQLVAELWESAVILVKDYDRFPLADNADFTAFLQGKNPHQVAWIRPGHPAVNAGNQLTDRWGSPLFFHRESSRRTALRSAGPDRTLWTGDDVVWPTP